MPSTSRTRLLARTLTPAILALAGGAAPAAPPDCAALIRSAHRQPDLPLPCRTLGPLHLGDPTGAAAVALGAPDAATVGRDGTRVAAWLFPRVLERSLAAHPVHPEALHYSVAYVSSRDSRIVAIRDESPGLALSLDFAGLRSGDPVARADRLLGPPTAINRSRDVRSYDPLPLRIEADNSGRRIAGFEIGVTAADLSGPIARGLPVMTADGRVRRLDLRIGA